MRSLSWLLPPCGSVSPYIPVASVTKSNERGCERRRSGPSGGYVRANWFRGARAASLEYCVALHGSAFRAPCARPRHAAATKTTLKAGHTAVILNQLMSRSVSEWATSGQRVAWLTDWRSPSKIGACRTQQDALNGPWKGEKEGRVHARHEEQAPPRCVAHCGWPRAAPAAAYETRLAHDCRAHSGPVPFH